MIPPVDIHGQAVLEERSTTVRKGHGEQLQDRRRLLALGRADESDDGLGIVASLSDDTVWQASVSAHALRRLDALTLSLLCLVEDRQGQVVCGGDEFCGRHGSNQKVGSWIESGGSFVRFELALLPRLACHGPPVCV